MYTISVTNIDGFVQLVGSRFLPRLYTIVGSATNRFLLTGGGFAFYEITAGYAERPEICVFDSQSQLPGIE